MFGDLSYLDGRHFDAPLLSGFVYLVDADLQWLNGLRVDFEWKLKPDDSNRPERRLPATAKLGNKCRGNGCDELFRRTRKLDLYGVAGVRCSGRRDNSLSHSEYRSDCSNDTRRAGR